MFVQMRDEGSIRALEKLISLLENKSTMIEIGSYVGESTILFSKYFDYVISIDPYIDNYDPNDPACRFAPFDSVYLEFLKNISVYPNIKHIRKKSDDAFNDFEQVDFVYIDGVHLYDQVKKDITNYLPKIKPGGFIGGHDYHPFWSGVVQAVDECLGPPDFIFEDTSWIKKI